MSNIVTVWGDTGPNPAGFRITNPRRSPIGSDWWIDRDGDGIGDDDGGFDTPSDTTINKPSITFPNASDNEDINEDDTSTSSVFGLNAGDLTRTHLASRWLVKYMGATTGDPLFMPQTIVYDSFATTVNKTSLPLTLLGGLEHESWYSICVRYKASDNHWSQWSEWQDFYTEPCVTMAWDPAASHADMALTVDNTVAQRTSVAPVDYRFAVSTDAKTSGKWYVEIVCGPGALVGATSYCIGLKGASVPNTIPGVGTAGNWCMWRPGGQVWANGAFGGAVDTYVENDVIGIALDMGTGIVQFFKNNVMGPSISISPAEPITLICACDTALGPASNVKMTIQAGPNTTYDAPDTYEKWI